MAQTIYRNEIDGLRAIAVLAVVCFHLELNIFHSGFAGVDIFFVISGYLVGGQLLQLLHNGSFSFSEFFYRRVKRILPALYVMILVSFFVGYWTMMPHPYQYFGGAAAATLFALSNFWFMDQINYFNPEASIDPLVHTWSLGVEEQFYLIAPVTLLLISKLNKSFLAPFVIAILVVSLLISTFFTEKFPEASFYLLHTRVWELALGMLIYLIRDQYRFLLNLNAGLKSCISYIGLLFICIGVGFIPSGVAWPGYWALVPTMGVAMILLTCSDGNSVYKILSIRIIRFVGIISYSFYLWHQPVIGFLKTINKNPDGLIQKLLTLFFILIISALSWAVIERPFRKQILGARTTKIFILLGFFMIFGLALGGHITKGYPLRLPHSVLDVLSLGPFKADANRRCLRSRDEVTDIDWDNVCLFSDHPSPTNVIWGDSHSASIADLLGQTLDNRGEGLELTMLSSCLPITNLIINTQNRAAMCPEFNQKAAEYIINSGNLENVFMFATWDNFFMHGAWPDMNGNVGRDEFFAYPIYGSSNMAEEKRIAAIITEFNNLVERLLEAGKNIYLIKSIPRPDLNIPVIYALDLWNGNPIPQTAGYPREYFEKQRQTTDLIFGALEKHFSGRFIEKLHIIDPAETFCDNEQCYVIKDNNILFSDGNHLTLNGARLLLKFFRY